MEPLHDPQRRASLVGAITAKNLAADRSEASARYFEHTAPHGPLDREALDARCLVARYTPTSGSPAMLSNVDLGGTRVHELTSERLTFRVPAIRISASPSIALGETTVRAYVPGARFQTPSRAFRP